MSSLSQFTGGRRIGSIVNAQSTAGSAAITLTSSGAMGKTYASGALTANTLATILSITGGGQVNYAGVYTADATSRTVRMKVTVDSVVVFDSTSAATAAANSGIVAVGYASYSTTLTPLFQPVRFNQSLLIEIASSLTETNKLTAVINYETNA